MTSPRACSSSRATGASKVADQAPPWISRKVFSFADVRLEDRPRAPAAYFCNPAIFATASGNYRFLGRYVAGGQREMIGLPLDKDLNYTAQAADLFSTALKRALPQVSWWADGRHFQFQG